MNLFEALNGREGEDIATEVVAFLLSGLDSNAPFQKLFYYRILGKLISSSEMKAVVETQRSSDIGRPDMIVIGDECIIFVETKLGSYLSGDNQLVRYGKLLCDDSKLKDMFTSYDEKYITNKCLCILAPANTIDICLNVSDRICRKEFRLDFLEWCKNLGINFIKIAWEDVLTDLQTDNLIHKELAIFVDKHIGQELAEDEMKVLNEKTLPGALNKIFTNISTIRDWLTSKGYKAKRIGQSYQYYGFSIVGEGYEAWFGYSLPTWDEAETPVLMQIADSWVTSPNKKKILESAVKLGFVKNDLLGNMKPFMTDDLPKWKPALENIIIELNKEDKST